jgi:hypothetical protein
MFPFRSGTKICWMARAIGERGQGAVQQLGDGKKTHRQPHCVKIEILDLAVIVRDKCFHRF